MGWEELEAENNQRWARLVGAAERAEGDGDEEVWGDLLGLFFGWLAVRLSVVSYARFCCMYLLGIWRLAGWDVCRYKKRFTRSGESCVVLMIMIMIMLYVLT